MTIKLRSAICISSAVLVLGVLGLAQQPSSDWPTWGGDPERTQWAKGETTLSREGVSRLEMKWRTQLDTVPSVVNYYDTLTDPIAVSNVATPQGRKTLVFVAGRTDNVYAVDADTGKVVWQRSFPNKFKQPNPPFTSCPNDLNATPTIDKEKGIIYVLNSDGRVRGLSLGEGEEVMPPTDFMAPYARPWSLNLIDGVLYTPMARGCGHTTSTFMGMDLTKPERPVFRLSTSTGRPAGAWGRGGLVSGPQGLYAQTADGPYDPAAGRFGNSVVAVTKQLQLVDSFTPANLAWLNQKDLDIGSASPAIFTFQKWTLVACAGKEGVIYLLDAKNLGGADHRTPLYASPRYGNDAVTFGFAGVWGAVSTYEDSAGQRWVLVPMAGAVAKDAPKFEHTNGTVENGSVMAFQVKVENDKPVLAPAWVSRDLELPGMPLATSGGVVFALSTGERGRFAAAGVAARPVRDEVAKLGANAIGDLYQGWNAANKPGQGQVQHDFAKRTDFSHGVLYAFDGATGKELYSSGELLDSWDHNGGMAVANGRIFVSTWDARLYSFGPK